MGFDDFGPRWHFRGFLRYEFFGRVCQLWELGLGLFLWLVEVLFEVVLKLSAAFGDLGEDNSDAIEVLHSGIEGPLEIEGIHGFDSLLDLPKTRVTFYLISFSF